MENSEITNTAEDDIDHQIKELLKENRKILSKIKELKSQQKINKQIRNNSLGIDKISWSTIAFQQRIYFSICQWSSPYKTSTNYNLQNTKNLIDQIGRKNKINRKKADDSLKEIEKLEKLPHDEIIKLARAYCNGIRNRRKRW